MSLDIADSSVRTSLTLAAPAGWDAGGLVAAGGVDGEPAEETGLAVDGQVEVSGDDEDFLAGEAAVDADDVVAPADVAGLVNAVDAGPDRTGDGGAGRGRGSCGSDP